MIQFQHGNVDQWLKTWNCIPTQATELEQEKVRLVQDHLQNVYDGLDHPFIIMYRNVIFEEDLENLHIDDDEGVTYNTFSTALLSMDDSLHGKYVTPRLDFLLRFMELGIAAAMRMIENATEERMIEADGRFFLF